MLVNDSFQPLPTDDDGVLRSTVLPGLWLDGAVVIRGDLAKAMAVLNQGIADPTHQQFVETLQSSSE